MHQLRLLQLVCLFRYYLHFMHQRSVHFFAFLHLFKKLKDVLCLKNHEKRFSIFIMNEKLYFDKRIFEKSFLYIIKTRNRSILTIELKRIAINFLYLQDFSNYFKSVSFYVKTIYLIE